MKTELGDGSPGRDHPLLELPLCGSLSQGRTQVTGLAIRACSPGPQSSLPPHTCIGDQSTPGPIPALQGFLRQTPFHFLVLHRSAEGSMPPHLYLSTKLPTNSPGMPPP